MKGATKKQRKRQPQSYIINKSPTKVIKTEEISGDENNVQEEEGDRDGSEQNGEILKLEVEENPTDVQLPENNDTKKLKARKNVKEVKQTKAKKQKGDGAESKQEKDKKKKKIAEVTGMNKLVENMKTKKNMTGKKSENEMKQPSHMITSQVSGETETSEKGETETSEKGETETSEKGETETSEKAHVKKSKELSQSKNKMEAEKSVKEKKISKRERVVRKSTRKKESDSKIDPVLTKTKKIKQKQKSNENEATETDQEGVKKTAGRKRTMNNKDKKNAKSNLDMCNDMSKKAKFDEADPVVVETDIATRKPRKKRVQKIDKSVVSAGGDCNVVQKKLGAHVSISGGMKNAVLNAVQIGAKSFAMFLKSQRQWNSKPLSDTEAEKFRVLCKEHAFPPHLILPHGSYLMNCGSPKPETLDKSRDALVDELERCEKLGLTLFNFHPGSTCGEISVDECLDRIAHSINLAHEKTKSVICVLENMSCQGHTVGGKFSELRGIIDRVKDKSRIGVCLDTCHAFAAGYDLTTEKGYNKMMADFDKEIGFPYLKGMHINDSKGKVGCHLDRHENIGRGQIGKPCFKWIMDDSRLDNLPLVLETPCPEDDTYAKEIKLMYKMCSD